MLRYCPDCGAKLGPDDEFCPDCGKKISKIKTEKEKKVIEKPEKKAKEAKAEPSSGKKYICWIVVGIIVVLFMVFFFISFFFYAGVTSPAPLIPAYKEPVKIDITEVEFKENQIIFFYFPGCPYCEKAEVYLDTITSKFGNQIPIKKINIHERKENMELANEYAQKLTGKDFKGVPFIIVNKNYIVGWSDANKQKLESFLGKAVTRAIERQVAKPTPRPIERPTKEMKEPSCIDNYVDFGTKDESCHNPIGWFKNYEQDKWMTLKAKQTVDLWTDYPNQPHILSFKHYDGQCDDSFEVHISGEKVFTFKHRQGGHLTQKVKVPERLVRTNKITVVFLNKASDECGRAGIDWVKFQKA